MRRLSIAVLTTAGLLLFAWAAWAWTPLPVVDDPLLRMPGTQPGDVSLLGANQCDNCHAGFDPTIEPFTLWRGSMMGMTAKDPLFWATVAVAAQDSIWVVGNPNATDLCLRCHMPAGWVEGRSDPTNASAMNPSDFDGIHCAACHQLVDPFYEESYLGIREGNDWTGYWDEATALAMTEADVTYLEDVSVMGYVSLFNGNAFYAANLPFSPTWIEAAAGQLFYSPNLTRRGPFADSGSPHSFLYSRFNKSKYFCSTCHDVSNTVLANLSFAGTAPGDGTTVLPSETDPAHSYFHVERTFSEFMLSDFGLLGGAPGAGPWDPALFTTSRPGNVIATCQDCHMPDGVGVAGTTGSAVNRPSGSIDHPNSGQPLHHFSGGNVWMPWILASTVVGSPNYDATNDLLLNQGASVLTMDLTYGAGIDALALLDGSARAQTMLESAAAIENLTYDVGSGAIAFRVVNYGGHKLPSGYPEGRRIFVNVELYSGGAIIHEVNPYDTTAGTLKGLPASYSPNSPGLSGFESHDDALVYEAHTTSSITGETKTFHFALADGRNKDNRIPPKGFRIAEAGGRLATPVSAGMDDPGMYTPAEYAGGYDDVAFTTVSGADQVIVRLYYQTTSREYVEFLRDEINGVGTSLSSPTPSGEPNAYIIQTDPFFSAFAAWGDTIWQLWDHNKNVPGALPVLMTETSLVPVTGTDAGVSDSGVPGTDAGTDAATGTDAAAGTDAATDAATGADAAAGTDAATGTDAGVPGTDSGAPGTDTGTGSDAGVGGGGGCRCQVGQRSEPPLAPLLLVIVLMALATFRHRLRVRTPGPGPR